MNRSDVWQFFKKKNDIPNVATCDLCQKDFKTSSNTSNLRDHLIRFHKNIYRPTASSSSQVSPLPSKQIKLETFFSDTKSYASGSTKKLELDKALMKMITDDLQPFNIVNNRGFKRFVQTLDPRYKLPDRHTLSNEMLPQMYDLAKTKLKALLSEIKHISLTTDMWTSITGDSYITVTSHFIHEWKLCTAALSTVKMEERHTGVNIASAINSILEDYNIKNNIVCIVTDNASTMTNAAANLKIKHLNCFAHTLQLVVSDMLNNPSVKTLIDKAKDIVRTFKTSSVALEILREEQRRQGLPELKVIQEVPTRWNSTYFMLDRLKSIGNALIIAISKLEKSSINYFSFEEAKSVEDITEMLSIFQEATETLSGENYCTSSLIIPTVFCLKNKLDKETPKTELGKTVLCLLKQGINTRLLPYEKRSVLQLATLLDPRWKKMGFTNPDNAEAAHSYFTTVVGSFLNKSSTVQQEDRTANEDVVGKKAKGM